MTGQTEDGTALREAWRDFCRRLEAAGDVIAQADLADTPLDRAEGYRYLTRLTRIALEMQVESADPVFPSFFSPSNATAKMGGDNPDNLYTSATIDGARSYRLTGRRGTVPILSFGTKANRYAIDGTMASTGELDSADLSVDADGRFEIIVSQDRPASGNWLPTGPDSTMLLVRQTFLDRANEEPAVIAIEPLSPATSDPLSAAFLEAGLQRTTAFVEGTARTFLGWVEMFRKEQFNQLKTIDQTMFFRAGGDPTIFYLQGYWSLAPDEALVIRTAIPECTFWNFQLCNIWMESLDYRQHRIHVNNHSAKLEPDGTATIVLAARDPGFGNWLNTTGHRHGHMLLRWTNADSHPVPETEVIKLG